MKFIASVVSGNGIYAIAGGDDCFTGIKAVDYVHWTLGKGVIITEDTVGLLYLRKDDEEIPSLEECLKRANIFIAAAGGLERCKAIIALVEGRYVT